MPASAFDTPGTDLGPLLVAFQAGDATLSESFFLTVSPKLKSIARRHLAELPEDIQAELVGETLMLLLRPTSVRFDTARGTAWKYIYGFALNAAKAIRSQNGRSLERRRSGGADVERPLPKVVSLQELADEPTHEPDADHRIIADQVLTKASTTIRVALERIYFDEVPRSRVAAELGIDRFALARQLAAFSGTFKEMRVGA